MLKYVMTRILTLIPILLCVAIFIFTLMYFVPGDPATIIAGPNATGVQIEELRDSLGFNDPYLVRLGRYLKGILTRFDFGRSYIDNGDVKAAIMERFPRTLIIAAASIVLSIVIGVPLGVNAAVHANSVQDRVSMMIALLGVSMPNFWLALILVIVFALNLGWLPALGLGGPEYYVLPCLANALGGIVGIARQTRSSMLEVIRSDYITTARAKGAPERSVIYRHALPNGLIPIITVAGSRFGQMMGGALVVETIFSIPGLGTYMIHGINNRDYNAVQASIIFIAFAFSVVMLIVDLIYAFVDPRIRARYVGKERRQKKNA